MNKNKSKDCPHCGRTISANKELCLNGFDAFGTFDNWFKSTQVKDESVEVVG